MSNRACEAASVFSTPIWNLVRSDILFKYIVFVDVTAVSSFVRIIIFRSNSFIAFLNSCSYHTVHKNKITPDSKQLVDHTTLLIPSCSMQKDGFFHS